SMIDAGILDGDLVVIRRQPDAADGDIVAAMVEGEEATVKRLFRQDGKVILRAENQAFPDMVFDHGVEVIGRVVSVLRSLR
ncbi:MAG TPA: S24 family peptidase, partial [Acidimicrobiia bacterium]|nr:S24 family peptidase [Acidimicrobiia bacterium]